MSHAKRRHTREGDGAETWVDGAHSVTITFWDAEGGAYVAVGRSRESKKAATADAYAQVPPWFKPVSHVRSTVGTILADLRQRA